jgi:thiamine monophosphate synthase
MMIIIISNPIRLKDEEEIIRRLFEEGLEIFHLRKKTYSESEVRTFIENLQEQNFKKIVLHSHYNLAKEYGLRGVHVAQTFKGENQGGTLSYSFHSLEEIQLFGRDYDYGFLSPIFDSISKEGYKSGFNTDEVKVFLKNRKENIIALGGIDEDNVKIAKELRFSGIALLGAIWQEKYPVDKYIRIKERWLK